MTQPVCTLCEARKPSRPCPLENGALICPQCCAKKRTPACGRCSFYLEAENYAIEKFRSTGKHHFKLDLRYEEDLDGILVLMEKKHFAECEKRLQVLAPLIPNSHLLYYVYGIVAGAQNDSKLALSYLNRCLEIFPFFVLAWYNKGIACQKLIDITGAAQAWEMVKRLTKPKDKMHQFAKNLLAETEKSLLKSSNQTIAEYIEDEKIYKLAFEQMFSGSLDAALSGFKKVLASTPEHVQSYGNIGLCHALAGNREEAITALEKALELDPSYQPAMQNLACVLAMKPGECLSRSKLAEPIEYYREKHLAEQLETQAKQS